MPTLTWERRGAGWRYTISVPKDCLPHYPSRLLRKTISETDRLKADELAHRWAAEMAAEFRRIRESGSPLKSSISESEASWLARDAAREFLEGDSDGRLMGLGQRDDDIEALEFYLTDLQVAAFKACAHGDTRGLIETKAREALEKCGYRLSEDSLAFKDFAMRLAGALSEAATAIRRRLGGEYVPTPISEPPPEDASRAPEAYRGHGREAGPFLSECFEQWKRKKARPAKTLLDTEAAISAFEEHHEKRGVLGYARRDAITWRDSLLHRKTKPLHARTVSKKLSLLRAVVQVAIDDELGGLKDATPNPFRNTEPDIPQSQRPRTAYSVEQLNALFSSPVYAAGERPTAGRGEAAYWLPLLALFTGARLEELGQLRVDDIAEERDITCLFLLPEAGSIKTGEGRRIPLHPELKRLGILRYVEAIKKAGKERAFPELERGAGGKFTDSWSKWYGRYLRETVGVTDKRITFHSFRHTFKDACREGDLEEEIHDALTGHKRGGVGRSYGGDRFPVVALAEAVKKISHPSVTLPEPWKAKPE